METKNEELDNQAELYKLPDTKQTWACRQEVDLPGVHLWFWREQDIVQVGNKMK